CAADDQGQEMMEGDYLSMKEIHSYMPDLVPKPKAWGKFKHSPPDSYFFLMEFIDVGSKMTDFCRLIAHLRQMSISPNAKFGFSQTTYHGPNPQNTTWEGNWCTYFTRLLNQFFDREIAQNGPQPEHEAAYILSLKVWCDWSLLIGALCSTS
ncbi:hypothetical protein LTR41_011896, partial [Exophiala xenobiotica]